MTSSYIAIRGACLPSIFIAFLTSSPFAHTQCRFNPPAQHSHEVSYAFVPELATGNLTLHVSLKFKMGTSGSERMIVPTQWAGEKLNSLRNLRLVSNDATLDSESGPDVRVVHAPQGTAVEVRYDLVKDWSGQFKNPLQFHPIITPQYVEFTGDNALIRPDFADADLETANFDWTGLPSGWALATSFGSSTEPSGRCQSFSAPWRAIQGGLFAAGDFRLKPFEIAGKPAMLAIRSDWTFTDEQATQQIATIVGLVRTFWKDNDFPTFLVTVAPYDGEHGSSDGSAFTNAFWMFISNRDSLEALLPQLAHESIHAWNPRRMGNIPIGYDEKYIRWFTEGTTEYYAQLLTLQAGYLKPDSYVSSLNQSLRRFPDSTDEYVRGRIISLWLDGTIRQESHQRHSLDNVMFDLVRHSSQPFTYERLRATIGAYLSPHSRAVLDQAIVHQGNLPAPSDIPRCAGAATASVQELPTFDLGFDFDSSKASMKATNVVVDGPAYRAGLRDGQILKGYSVSKWEPDHLVTLKITAETGEQRISFYPRGRTESVWQYTLRPNAECARISSH